MNVPNHSAVSPLALTWFNCSKIIEPQSVAVGVLPGMKFKSTWRNVDQDIKTLIDNGISDVFCLCKMSELKFFRVRELFDKYRSKQIRVHHFPLEPDGAPDYKELKSILMAIWNTILEGGKVYVHGYSLLGRVSVAMAALYMELEETVTPSLAICKIRELVGNGAFQTMQQYNFVEGFREFQEQHKNDFL